MLDEIKEYEEYVSMPGGALLKNPRLLSSDISAAKFIGLVRPLTIIARKVLYDDLNYANRHSEAEIKEAVAETTDALRVWLGFDPAAMDRADIPDITPGWFKKFFLRHLKNDEAAWEKVATVKEKMFSGNMISQVAGTKKGSQAKGGSSENTYNAVTYQRIIADAVYEGALRRKYLVCKKGFADTITYAGKSLKGRKLKSSRDADMPHTDLVLKYIAAYLMTLEKMGKKEEFVFFKKIDLYNWIQCASVYKNDKTKFSYSFFEYASPKSPVKPQKLFDLLKFTNVAKYSINQDFLREFDFRLEDDVSGLSDEYTFFSDGGSGYPLMEGMMY